jgi:RimJ/RimL family protein N-acetyltransferase
MQHRVRGLLTELRPATSADLETLVTWLNDPDIYHWWGGDPISRDEVEAKYTGARSSLINSFIVEEGGIPVGYIQSCKLNESTCGIDIFLDPAMQSRGLATDAVRALSEFLIRDEGWQVVTADPASDNLRARALWQRAGFVASGRITDEGNLEFVFNPASTRFLS